VIGEVATNFWHVTLRIKYFNFSVFFLDTKGESENCITVKGCVSGCFHRCTNACRSAQPDLVISVSVAFCLKTLFKLLVLALMVVAAAKIPVEIFNVKLLKRYKPSISN
jgi:hypothetical protein